MSIITRAAGAAAALLVATATAGAQTTPRIALSAAEARRWDVSGHLTWLGEHKPVTARAWDQWYGVAAAGLSVGYRTGHLTFEIDSAAAQAGEVYEQERLDLPGLAYPYFRLRQHHFQTTTLGASAVWQFFENQWVQPFVAAGGLLVREADRVESPIEAVPLGAQGAIVSVAAVDGTTRIAYTVRPMVTAGSKFYVTDRAFIRTDIRASWSPEGAINIGWRSGVGIDF